MKEIVYTILYSLYAVAMTVLLFLLRERWQNRLYKDAGWGPYEEDPEWNNL